MTALRRVPAAVWIAGLIAVLGALVWVFTHPSVADLAAQQSRAHLVDRDGFAPYSTAWFSGFDLPSYSVWVPWLMSRTSVFAVGAVATVVAAVAGGTLFLKTPRPLVGSSLFAVAMLTNLFSGRVTFASGCALGLVALAIVVRRNDRASIAASAVAAVLTTTASPVAALFLMLACVVLALTRTGGERVSAVVCLVAAAVPLLVLAWLTPGAGYQPFALSSAVLTLSVSLGLTVAPLPRVVRLGAGFSSVAVVLCYFVHTPVGSNVSRLAMLAGVPVAAACLRVRPAVTALLVLMIAWWPVKQVTEDLVVAKDHTTQEAYYDPLVTKLNVLPALASHRLEVVEPRSHWQAYYLLGAELARGWNRQLDESLNPLFYGAAPLTPATYRSWLDDNAVAYVALPKATIDFGSADESALVARGLPYLSLAWQDPEWSLYAVHKPAPIADGVVDATAWDQNGVRVHAAAVGSSIVHVHWSPFLELSGVRGCTAPAGRWTLLHFDSAGDGVVQPHWTLGRSTTKCSSGAAATS